MAGQLIGQEVVHSLVAFIVLVDVANEYFHHNAAVLQHTHIFLEVAGSGEKTPGTCIDGGIKLYIIGEVIPVRIKNESHFLDSADSDYLDKILRQRPFLSQVLDAADRYGGDTVLACLLRFLFSFLDVESWELLFPLVHLPHAFRDVYGRTAAGRRLVLERFPFLVPVFVRELPADAVIHFELLLATPRQFTGISDRHAVQVVIFDDDIIPINDIAVFVNGSRTESLRLENALCISLLEDMCRHVLIGQSAAGKHTGAECIYVFSLGLLAPFFHFGGFGSLFLRLRIEQYIEFACQVITCFQELHVFRPLQIVQRFLAFYIRATEAFENLFGRRDM